MLATAWYGEYHQEVFVYEHRKERWQRTQRITRETESHRFGLGLAHFDDTAVIGSAGEDWAGAAFVYTRTSGRWVEAQRLSPPHLEAEDNFGRSVALDSNTIVVAAPGRSMTPRRRGVVHIFAR